MAINPTADRLRRAEALMTTTLLRRSAVAEMLAVSERTIRRWGASGRLDERKIGPRAVRVTEASVQRLLRADTGAAREDR